MNIHILKKLPLLSWLVDIEELKIEIYCGAHVSIGKNYIFEGGIACEKNLENITLNDIVFGSGFIKKKRFMYFYHTISHYGRNFYTKNK